MTDVFFRCRACGKHLVVADKGVGLTIYCPGCQTAITVPDVLVVHQCPHCRMPIKSAAEMKGERIDCPECGKDSQVPGTPESQPGTVPTIAYICPACQAEVAAPEQPADQTRPCPSCGSQVHFRRKLRLKKSMASLPLLPERHRWRQVVALAILVIFAVLISIVFFKIKSALQ